MNQKTLYTITEASEMLNVSRSFVYRAIKRQGLGALVADFAQGTYYLSLQELARIELKKPVNTVRVMRSREMSREDAFEQFGCICDKKNNVKDFSLDTNNRLVIKAEYQMRTGKDTDYQQS